MPMQCMYSTNEAAMNLSILPHAEQVAAILTASPEALRSAWASRNGAKSGIARKARTNVPRCPCGEMTAKRAEARGHKC